MKIFRMHDYEWVAGQTLEECKEYLRELTGLSDEEAFDEPYEISEDAYDKLIFCTDEVDEKGKEIKRTFREELNLRIKDEPEFPVMFATTEY